MANERPSSTGRHLGPGGRVCTVLGVRIYEFRSSVFYLINKRIWTSNLVSLGLSFLYGITF